MFTTPFPVPALALILMGLGSGIFWSPLVSVKVGAKTASHTWSSRW